MDIFGFTKAELDNLFSGISGGGGGASLPSVITQVANASYTVPVGYNAKIVLGVAYALAGNASNGHITVNGAVLIMKPICIGSSGVDLIEPLYLLAGHTISLSGLFANIELYAI